MGFLKEGIPLSYVECQKLTDKLRGLGILQFINVYKLNANRFDPNRSFGDEIEYMLVNIDHENRKVQLLPAYPHLISYINSNDNIKNKKSYVPEYASYMMEVIPDEPYDLNSDFTTHVKTSLYNRRKSLDTFLKDLGFKDTIPLTITSFPRLGCEDCIYIPNDDFKTLLRIGNDISQSRYLNDVVINPHERFSAITRNIRLRRGGVKINVDTYRSNGNDSNSLYYNNSSKKPINYNSTSTIKSFNTKGYMTDPPEVTTTVGLADSSPPLEVHPAVSSSNYLPVNGNTTPGDRGEDGRGVDGIKSSTGPQVEPAADLREAKGELNREGRHGEWKTPGGATSGDEDKENTSFGKELVDVDEILCNGVEKTDDSSIYMDGVIFGMGMCCLQTTFSCININEARYLYDQLVVLAPIFLSLTAATVAYRGKLSNLDTRFSVLNQAMDDRTKDEYDLILKSRYSSSSLYIGNESILIDNYEYLNDLNVYYIDDLYKKLIENGIDYILARHISHLFIYQPLVVYDEDFLIYDNSDSIFEIFQSTNWNSVRFKPPPLNNLNMPWRIEFRCCEVQYNDNDNTLFICIIAYIVKVLLNEHWNLYMPLSKVDFNIKISEQISSITKKLFYFPNDIINNDLKPKLQSLYDILFNNNGIITRCKKFLINELNMNTITLTFYNNMNYYFNILENKTKGYSLTNAQIIRKFIINHPKFNNNNINNEIQYQLINKIIQDNNQII